MRRYELFEGTAGTKLIEVDVEPEPDVGHWQTMYQEALDAWNEEINLRRKCEAERDEARKLSEALLEYCDDLAASTCGCHYKELKLQGITHPCKQGLPWIEDRAERLDPRGNCQ
jgi:hypothetical protein